MTRQFLGFVGDDGKFTIDDRSGFRRHLDTLKGYEVTVTVERRSRQRSVKQNAWLWGVAYPLIAESCGYDHHEHEHLHYDLLSVRFGTHAVNSRIPGVPPRIVPTRTSSELSTKEMAEYFEWLVRYAAETFGVVLELPDERGQLRRSS